MSKSKRNEASNDDNNFREYREIAHESVGDDALRKIIAQENGDKEKINAAIERMWQEIPDKQPDSVWISTSRKKHIQPSHDVQHSSNDNRRGRSAETGRNSGRNLRSVGGRTSSIGGRGTRTRVSSTDSQISDKPTKDDEKVDIPLAWTKNETGIDHWSGKDSSISTIQPPTSQQTRAWVDGSFAEKLRLAEKNKVVSLPEVAPPVAVSAEASLPGCIGSLRDHFVVQMIITDDGSNPRATSGGDTPTTSDDVSGVKPRKSKNKSRGRKQMDAEDIPSSAKTVQQELGIVEVENIVEEITSSVVEFSIQHQDIQIVEEIKSVDQQQDEGGIVNTSTSTVLSENRVVLPEPVPIQEAVVASKPSSLLKLGKWESPAESVENSAFQFGSFGFGTDDQNSNGSSNGWPVVSDPLTQTATDTSGVTVWGASSQNSSSSIGDVSSVGSSAVVNSSSSSLGPLFPPSAAKNLAPVSVDPSVASQSSRFDQKPSAPPGLEMHNNKSSPPNHQTRSAPGHQTRPKHEGNQSQPQQLQHQFQTQYTTYSQPPGISPRPGVPGMPQYYSSFDISQQPPPYMHPSYNPGSGPVAASTAGTSSTSVGSSVTTSSSTPTAQQQQQQYAPPPGIAPSPYYYHPTAYFPGQPYFYGQQVPNYYGQGRSVYQAPRGPYADPYSNGGSLYPDVYQGGQFDSGNGYGGIPLHPPSVPLPTTGSGSTSSNSGSKSKGASGASSVQQAPHIAPELSAHSTIGYYNNPYAPRSNDQAWQYQNGNQGWANVVSFPSNSPTATTPSVPGFQPNSAATPPQQQQQVQSGRENNQQRPPGNGYPNASFGNRTQVSSAGPTAGGHNW